MEVIVDQTFDAPHYHNRQLIADLRLERCTFNGAGMTPEWAKPDPLRRPTFRNVYLRDVRADHAHLEGAIIEDVTVENMKAGKSPLFLRGNAYRHVTFRGRIAPLEIRGKVFPGFTRPEAEARVTSFWDQANAAYYTTVDWAIDISEATYASLSISGVPTKLIRRNPQNTAVVTREAALTGRWKNLVMKRGLFKVAISWFVDDGYEDMLLIACPKGKRYEDDLTDLAMLRDAGIAM
jgi:hypothetical protein